MPKSPREEETTGCFAWLVQIKKSMNERWAKARNRLRQRFHKDNGAPLKPEDLISENGMPDMIITKIPMKDKTSTPTPEPLTEGQCIGFRASATPSDETEADGNITDEKIMTIRGTADGEPDQTEVRLFVVDLIQEACNKYKAETAILPPTPTPRDYKNSAEVEEDAASLSSSVLSALAEVVVSESLSKVMEDMNESAKSKVSPPRTVSEVLERLSIDPNIGIVKPESTDMPPCSG